MRYELTVVCGGGGLKAAFINVALECRTAAQEAPHEGENITGHFCFHFNDLHNTV